MAKLFGTSGARGTTNKQITPDFAFLVAAIYGVMLREKKGGRPQVVVGHDQRFGADMLAYSTIAGFQSVGVDVMMLGMVSTGVYSVFLQQGKFDGGILITGSHMPPDRIGIIPMLPNAHYADRDVTDVIEARLGAFDLTPHMAAFQDVGVVTRGMAAKTRYAHHLYDLLRGSGEAIENARFRVLLDPGNGTSGAVAQTLFYCFDGLEREVINAEPLPIPNRLSECTPENCSEAIARTRDGGFALGACFDGDADRVMFIADDGSVPTDDQIGALFATHLLGEGDTLVTPVNASRLIEAVCASRGITVRYCRIGQPSTDTAVREHGAKFAYEAAARKYGFGELQCCYDGVYATAKLLALMAQTGKSLAQLTAELPKFYQAAVRVEVEEAHKAAVVARATEAVCAELSDRIERTDTTDGTKWFFKGGAWLLLRPSGTESLVRAYSDARSQEEADTLIALARTALEQVLS